MGKKHNNRKRLRRKKEKQTANIRRSMTSDEQLLPLPSLRVAIRRVPEEVATVNT